MGAVHGHPADRVEQHDVVDDGLGWSGAGAPPASVAGPGEATNVARPRRTWTSSARIDRATSSAVSAPRSRPAGARRAARRSSGIAGVVAQPRADDRRARRRGDEAHVRHVACQRGGRAPPRPRPLASRRPRPGQSRGRAPRCPCRRTTRSAPGKACGSAIGSKTETRQPAAEPSVTRAPAMGVVPATHRTGAGRCGST